MVCFDIIDAERFSTAPVIPHHLDYVNPPVGFQGVYVVPQMSFSETGKIETWEVFASSEGQVKLQVIYFLINLCCSSTTNFVCSLHIFLSKQSEM